MAQRVTSVAEGDRDLPVVRPYLTTTGPTLDQWAAAVGASVLWVEELRKAVVRRRQRAGATR